MWSEPPCLSPQEGHLKFIKGSAPQASVLPAWSGALADRVLSKSPGLWLLTVTHWWPAGRTYKQWDSEGESKALSSPSQLPEVLAPVTLDGDDLLFLC